MAGTGGRRGDQWREDGQSGWFSDQWQDGSRSGGPGGAGPAAAGRPGETRPSRPGGAGPAAAGRPDENQPGRLGRWQDDTRPSWLSDDWPTPPNDPRTPGTVQPDPWRKRPAPKRGRLLVGFALGAATVLAVQFGSGVVGSVPVAVVGGTAVPVAGAAAPAASPSPAAASADAPAPVATSAPSTAAAPVAQAPPPASPPPQRPGTVRLPGGGTAALVRKDLGPGGELPVPADLGQATWWGADLGAAGGASVFAGHVNWRGATGPFAELWTTKIGGLVTIVDSGGKTWRYRVSQLLTVHKNDLAARADDLFGQSGPHRVVLVTCGGRWVGGSDGYEENRVVIADPA